MRTPFALIAMAAVLMCGMPPFAMAASGEKKHPEKSGQQSQDATKGGLGLTNRPGAGGGMGEETTPKGSVEGPRGLPAGKAPGYEQADEGKGQEGRFHGESCKQSTGQIPAPSANSPASNSS